MFVMAYTTRLYRPDAVERKLTDMPKEGGAVSVSHQCNRGGGNAQGGLKRGSSNRYPQHPLSAKFLINLPDQAPIRDLFYGNIFR